MKVRGSLAGYTMPAAARSADFRGDDACLRMYWGERQAESDVPLGDAFSEPLRGGLEYCHH
jgi:hypothetical protein